MFEERKNKAAQLTELSDLLSSSKTAETAVLDIMKKFDTSYINYLESTISIPKSTSEEVQVFFQFQSERKVNARMENDQVSFMFAFSDKAEAREFVREIRRFNKRMQRTPGEKVKMSIVASCGGSFYVSADECVSGNVCSFYVSMTSAKLRILFPDNY